jgi:hypothetical protein
MVPRDVYLYWIRFHRVISPAKPGGIEEDAENLDIVFRCNASNDDAYDEEANSAYQSVQKREDRAACNQGDEKQPPFRAKHGQRAVHCLEDLILPRAALFHAYPPLLF